MEMSIDLLDANFAFPLPPKQEPFFYEDECGSKWMSQLKIWNFFFLL